MFIVLLYKLYCDYDADCTVGPYYLLKLKLELIKTNLYSVIKSEDSQIQNSVHILLWPHISFQSVGQLLLVILFYKVQHKKIEKNIKNIKYKNIKSKQNTNTQNCS